MVRGFQVISTFSTVFRVIVNITNAKMARYRKENRTSVELYITSIPILLKCSPIVQYLIPVIRWVRGFKRAIVPMSGGSPSRGYNEFERKKSGIVRSEEIPWKPSGESIRRAMVSEMQRNAVANAATNRRKPITEIIILNGDIPTKKVTPSIIPNTSIVTDWIHDLVIAAQPIPMIILRLGSGLAIISRNMPQFLSNRRKKPPKMLVNNIVAPIIPAHMKVR